VTTIPVSLGERSYEVRVEAGALDRAGDWLARYARGGRFVVVTDEHLAVAQLPRLQKGLGAASLSIDPIVFFKLILIGYLQHLGSDRRIIKYAYRHAAF